MRTRTRKRRTTLRFYNRENVMQRVGYRHDGRAEKPTWMERKSGNSNSRKLLPHLSYTVKEEVALGFRARVTWETWQTCPVGPGAIKETQSHSSDQLSSNPCNWDQASVVFKTPKVFQHATRLENHCLKHPIPTCIPSIASTPDKADTGRRDTTQHGSKSRIVTS